MNQFRAQRLSSISLPPLLCLVSCPYQPLCCAKSSHRDFWTDTLLSPALKHPLVLPVAPAYVHIIYGPAMSASLRISLLHRSERKPHRLCPSQQWCVVSGVPLQQQASSQHGNSSWWKEAPPGRVFSASSWSTCPSPVTKSWVITGISQTSLRSCTTHK